MDVHATRLRQKSGVSRSEVPYRKRIEIFEDDGGVFLEKHRISVYRDAKSLASPT